MTKIDHIGIAVDSIGAASKIYELLLGTNSYKEEIVASELVKTSFFGSTGFCENS